MQVEYSQRGSPPTSDPTFPSKVLDNDKLRANGYFFFPPKGAIQTKLASALWEGVGWVCV